MVEGASVAGVEPAQPLSLLSLLSSPIVETFFLDSRESTRNLSDSNTERDRGPGGAREKGRTK